MKYLVDKLFWGIYDDFEIIEAKSRKHAVQKYMKDFRNSDFSLKNIISTNKSQYWFVVFPVKINEERFVKWRYEWLTKIWKRIYMWLVK